VSVLRPDIHLGVAVEQHPHLLRVLILRRVDQPQLCACGRCTDNQEQRRGEREPDTCVSAWIYHSILAPTPEDGRLSRIVPHQRRRKLAESSLLGFGCVVRVRGTRSVMDSSFDKHPDRTAS
jgi:hypothetical protein